MVCDTPLMLMSAFLRAGEPTRPPSIGSVESKEIAARCWWDREEDAKKCDAAFQALQDAWSVQVDEIGFPPPMPDDDGIFDIYFHDYPSGGAYTYCSTWLDPSGDGRTSCPAFILLARTIPETQIPIFVAHEFNHALQFAVDWREWTLPIWEGVATAAESWTLDSTPLPGTIHDYQAATWLGILGDSYFLYYGWDLWSFYEYGSVLWVLHLDATYGSGDGTVGGRDLWLNTAQEGKGGNFVTVLDSLDTITGDWRASLMEFSVARTRVATEDEPSWAKGWTVEAMQLTVEDEVDFGSLPLTVTPEVAPFGTGASYVRVTGVPSGSTLHVEAQDDADKDWGILVVEGKADDWTSGATYDWAAGGGEILVGVVSLEDDGFASSGDTADLWAGQSSLDIALSVTGGGTDTGNADGGSDGTPDGDADGGDAGTDDGDAASDDGEEPGGCGCGTGPKAPGWAPIAAILMGIAVARRRKLDR